MRASGALLLFTLRVLISSLSFQPSGASLEIITRGDDGHVTAKKSHAIADFVHFDAPEHPGVNGSAIVLSGKDACGDLDEKFLAEVHDKVVFTESRECRISDVYMKMDRAGAKALVLLEPFFKHPGFLSFYCYDCHGENSPRGFVPPSWNDGLNMPMVSVASMGNEDSLSHDPTIEEVRISPPFDRSFKQLFLSYHWTLLVRVLAPAFSLATSVLAGSEVLRLKREGRFRRAWISGIICATEAPVLFLVALILAFGHFGPMALDYVYHEILRDLFLGFSISTTLLFSLFLREETRWLIQSLPRRSIWKVHRWGLVASLSLFVSNVLRLIAMISFESAFQALVVVNLAITIALQCTVGLYLFSQSWALRRHFKGFLAATSTASQSQAAIKKMTYYITMSSVCMLICSFSAVLLTLPYISGGALVYDIGTYYTLVIFITYSRIGYSFAQIVGIVPNVQLPNVQLQSVCSRRYRVQAHSHRDNSNPRADESPAIEGEAKESEPSQNMYSSEMSGRAFSIGEDPCSSGISESTIQYVEIDFSDEEIREFPPCPE